MHRAVVGTSAGPFQGRLQSPSGSSAYGSSETVVFVSSLMPSLLTTMQSNELLPGDVYLLSALAALQKVVETLPHFISPYLEGVLSQVSLRDHDMLFAGQGRGVKSLMILFFKFLVSSLAGRFLYLKRCACYY